MEMKKNEMKGGELNRHEGESRELNRSEEKTEGRKAERKGRGPGGVAGGFASACK